MLLPTQLLPPMNCLLEYLSPEVFKLHGYITNDALLYLTKYLEKEDDILVWDSALKRLGVSDWELFLSDYELYPVLKKYFLPRILPIYHHCAHLLQQEVEGDYIYNYNIETIIGVTCWFGLRDCLDLASKIFTKWMNNANQGSPACFSRTICCYAVQLGGDKEWEFLWKRYNQNSTRLEEKYDILLGLSCTREPWLLQRFLHDILNDSSSTSNLVTDVVEQVAGNEVGRWIAWTFLMDNWSHLYNRSGFRTLRAMTRSVNTDIEIQMIQSFLNSTLEPQQRINATKILQRMKSSKEERRDSVIQMIKWIKTNADA